MDVSKELTDVFISPGCISKEINQVDTLCFNKYKDQLLSSIWRKYETLKSVVDCGENNFSSFPCTYVIPTADTSTAVGAAVYINKTRGVGDHTINIQFFITNQCRPSTNIPSHYPTLHIHREKRKMSNYLSHIHHAEWSGSEIVSLGSWVRFPPSGLVCCTGTWSAGWKLLPVHKVWWTPLVDGKMVPHIPGYVYSHPILQDRVVWFSPVCCMHLK
jgi:hypothetical protein